MAIFGRPSSTSPEKDSPRHEIGPTYVGAKVRLQGDLTGDEDVVFDGRVEGRVNVARTFRVGPEGQVHAEVTARVVVIGGRVVGNVVASDRVELLPTGVLEGNIRAPKIVIAEGAQFRGSVDMEGRPDVAAATPPGAASGR
jgi:cytoskeletal protein CcmA (bactofilin family)